MHVYRRDEGKADTSPTVPKRMSISALTMGRWITFPGRSDLWRLTVTEGDRRYAYFFR
jgi:hypothetical protein